MNWGVQADGKVYARSDPLEKFRLSVVDGMEKYFI